MDLGLNVPKYLSHSSLNCWLENRDEFFIRYLSVDRVQKVPQNHAMSVGSAFDAYVKAWLSRRVGDKLLFDDLFTKQVEPHNRDWALVAGAKCFISYKESGALDALLQVLLRATEIKFEQTEKMDPETGQNVGDAVILGKPDLTFRINHLFVLDWKVNGYLSANGKSPTQGYIWCNHKMHKDCTPTYVDDVLINMDRIHDDDWCNQLSTYAWLCGSPVGGEFVAMIDQLACKDGDIRVAQHRSLIDKDFQIRRYNQFQELWKIVHSNHIFREYPLEESISRCKILSGQASVYETDSDKHRWLKSAIRGK